MTPAEKLEHIKALNRARAKKFYDANKAKVADRRKEVRKEVRELREAAAAAPEPEAPAAAPVQRARRNTVARKIRQAATGRTVTIIPSTTEANVTEAMKTTDHYGADSSRKTDMDQVKLMFRAINNEQLYPWLKKPNEFIAALKELRQTHGEKKGQPYALSALARILSAALNIIKIMKLPVTEEEDKILFSSFRIAKITHQLHKFKENTDLTQKNAVLHYDKMLKNVLKTYGKASLTYLVAMLYKHAPLRNDYSHIILIKSKSEIKPDKNYMILPTSGNAEIYIQKHKTKNKSGTIATDFPADVTTLLRNYVTNKKIEYGKYLFGDLKEVLHAITQDTSADKVDGGSRIIRRSLASTLYHKYTKGQATPSDIWHQSRLMAHNETTHILDYIYGVK